MAVTTTVAGVDQEGVRPPRWVEWFKHYQRGFSVEVCSDNMLSYGYGMLPYSMLSYIYYLMFMSSYVCRMFS